jgi:thiol-disulfide isomerase/thioredoxin
MRLAACTLAPVCAQAAANAADDNSAPLPRLGALLPLPEVTLLDGTLLRPADAEGRVLVLYWWASWCPFCAQQSPLMDQLWLSQRAKGLRMLGLSIDRKAEDASSYLAKRGYSFPAALLTPALAQLLPKPRGLPVTVVRGRDGRVLAAEAGQLFPEDIEQFARFL